MALCFITFCLITNTCHSYLFAISFLLVRPLSPPPANVLNVFFLSLSLSLSLFLSLNCHFLMHCSTLTHCHDLFIWRFTWLSGWNNVPQLKGQYKAISIVINQSAHCAITLPLTLRDVTKGCACRVHRPPRVTFEIAYSLIPKLIIDSSVQVSESSERMPTEHSDTRAVSLVPLFFLLVSCANRCNNFSLSSATDKLHVQLCIINDYIRVFPVSFIDMCSAHSATSISCSDEGTHACYSQLCGAEYILAYILCTLSHTRKNKQTKEGWESVSFITFHQLSWCLLFSLAPLVLHSLSSRRESQFYLFLSLSLYLSLSLSHQFIAQVSFCTGYFAPSARQPSNAPEYARHSLMANLFHPLCLLPHLSFMRFLPSFFTSPLPLQLDQFSLPPSPSPLQLPLSSSLALLPLSLSLFSSFFCSLSASSSAPLNTSAYVSDSHTHTHSLSFFSCLFFSSLSPRRCDSSQWRSSWIVYSNWPIAHSSLDLLTPLGFIIKRNTNGFTLFIITVTVSLDARRQLSHCHTVTLSNRWTWSGACQKLSVIFGSHSTLLFQLHQYSTSLPSLLTGL